MAAPAPVSASASPPAPNCSPALSTGASAAAPDPLCTQCFWQPRLAADDPLCAECHQWRVELNVGGIPGRSVVARRAIAEGDCILTESPQQFYCVLDPQAAATATGGAADPHRASTAIGAYEQVLRQMAAQYLADAPHVRDIIDALHCVDEDAFLLHHLPRDPAVLRVLRLAKELHRDFQKQRSALQQPCPSEAQFVSWAIKLRLNAWFLVSVPPLRLVLSTLIAALNHSCVPNAVSVLARRVYAVRPIAAGESIFITYIKTPLLRTMSPQQCRERFEDWNFVCACARCAGPPDRDWSQEWDAIEAWRTKLTALHTPPPPPRASSGFERFKSMVGSLWSSSPSEAAASTPKQG